MQSEGKASPQRNSISPAPTTSIAAPSPRNTSVRIEAPTLTGGRSSAAAAAQRKKTSSSSNNDVVNNSGSSAALGRTSITNTPVPVSGSTTGRFPTGAVRFAPSSISTEKLEAMRAEAKEVFHRTDEDTADAVDAICDANGWTRDDFIQSRHTFTHLEIFLAVFPTFQYIRYFPNLVHVKIMHASLKEINAEDLRLLTNLETLWISENDLTTVRNGTFKCCPKLKEIYAHNNNFTSIEPFLHLPELEVLVLSRNRITSIEGLESLPKLRSLYLASNSISRIRGCFDKNLELEELNLAGNKISSFREIPCLNVLPKLSKLFFADPTYGDNPITLMMNYQTFTLCHVRSVIYLDYIIVTNEQRAVAESTYAKKRVFYSMRLQTMERTLDYLKAEAFALIAGPMKEAEAAIVRLEASLQEWQLELTKAEGYANYEINIAADRSRTTEIVSNAVTQLQLAVTDRRKETLVLQRELEAASSEMSVSHRLMTSRLLLELDTGGNVRLEEGRPKDLWFQSCSDLLRNRFFSGDYQHYGLGITDVAVSKVTRIHNTALRAQFDRELIKSVDISDPGYKKLLEYLFFALPVHGCSEVPSEVDCVSEIVEFGFKYLVAGEMGHVPMTNSLYLSDQIRLMEVSKAVKGSAAGDGKLVDASHIRNVAVGKVIVAKAFLARPAAERGMIPSSTDVPLLRAKPLDRSAYGKDVLSVSRGRSDDTKQRIWYSFDDALVLPEYIIDFTYKMASPGTGAAGGSIPPTSPLAASIASTTTTASTGGDLASTSASVALTGASSFVKSIVTPKPAAAEWPTSKNEAMADALRSAFPSASNTELIDMKNLAPYWLAFKAFATTTVAREAKAREASEAAIANLPTNRNARRASLVPTGAPHPVLASLAATIVSSSSVATDGDEVTINGEKEATVKAATAGLSLEADHLTTQISLWRSEKPATTLMFAHSKISGLSFGYNLSADLLSKLTTVTTLDLSSNVLNLRVGEWGALANGFANLQRLILRDNSIISLPKVSQLIVAAPLAAALIDQSNSNAAEQHGKSIVFPSLQHLDLSKNAIAEVGAFESLKAMFPALESLSVTGNPIGTASAEVAGKWLRYVVFVAAPASLAIVNGLTLEELFGGSLPKAGVNSGPASDRSTSTLSSSSARNGIHSTWDSVTRYPSVITESLVAAVLQQLGAYLSNGYFALSSAFNASQQQSSASGAAGGKSSPALFITSESGDLDILSMKPHFELALRAAMATRDFTCYAAPNGGISPTSSAIKGASSLQVSANTAAAIISQLRYLSISNTFTSAFPSSIVTSAAEHLTCLQLEGHYIRELDGAAIRSMNKLESISLRHNFIRFIPTDSFSHLPNLKRLDLGFNQLRDVGDLFSSGTRCANLAMASFDNNYLKSVYPFSALDNLQELYLSNNLIANEKDLNTLRDISKLIILDLSGCPCVKNDSYRTYLVFHLRRLKVLDGTPIDVAEATMARDIFAGRVSAELLNERIAPATKWSLITELNLSSGALKEVLLLDEFTSLQHLRLEHNSLATVDGLKKCVKLITLNLADNKLADCAVGPRALNGMTMLESLSLEANGVTSLAALQLDLPRLKFLNLKANELTKLDGTERLQGIRELVLDRNKIKSLERESLLHIANLRDLHCEENVLKSLEALPILRYLVNASFATNRLGDIQDTLRSLEGSPLVTLSLLGNAVIRKPLYRNGMIHAMSCLKLLDGKPVTMEERERVEMTYQPSAGFEGNGMFVMSPVVLGGGPTAANNAPPGPIVTNAFTPQLRGQQPAGPLMVGGAGSLGLRGQHISLGEAPRIGDEMLVVGSSALVPPTSAPANLRGAAGGQQSQRSPASSLSVGLRPQGTGAARVGSADPTRQPQTIRIAAPSTSTTARRK